MLCLKHCGNGYAEEAAGVPRYGFQELGIERTVVFALPQSQTVLMSTKTDEKGVVVATAQPRSPRFPAAGLPSVSL